MTAVMLPGRLRKRLPRRSVRLQLTLLYGVLFLLCGAALLAVTYFLVDQRLGVMVQARSVPTIAAPADGQYSQFCASTSAGGPAGGPAGAAAGVLGGGLAPPSVGSNGCRYLAKSLSVQRNSELEQLLIDCGIALGIMAVASIGLGWLMAGRVLRPLRTITAAARRVSASNLNQRLALAGPDDELRELGETFNGLLARLEGSFQAQRLFVVNASHELRTPLARQRTLVEVALADPQRSADSLQAACERVLAAGEQQERLIEALLTLARSQRGLDHREPLDLRAATAEVLQSHESDARRRGLRVSSALGPAATSGDPRLVERLTVNLIDNALRHNVPGGWVEVTTGTRPGCSVISVANSGPPVQPPEVSALFEPFRRPGADRAVTRDGHGLGLSIVAAIAAAHDARLSAHALPAGGLAVDVCFPPLHDAVLPPAAGTVPQRYAQQACAQP